MDLVLTVLWLGLGLVIGYVVGVARTTLYYMEIMKRELHECHVALHRKDDGHDEAAPQ